MALPPAIRRPLEYLGVLDPMATGATDEAPIRQASPESEDAPPPIGTLISRSGENGFVPDQWLKVLAENTDTILRRDGGGLKLYDALLDDDTAFSTLQQRRLAITSREWEVAPGDEKDPRSVKAADEFRAMLKAVGFDRVTGLLHYAVWYGYAVGEALYEAREFEGRQIIWLKDIVVPDRRWFGFTLEGELRLAQPYVTGLVDDKLPDNKFVSIRTGGTHDFAFYGLGLAHWCYWPIFFKRSALKFWALYLEKFGRPTVAIEFPESEKDDKAKLDARLAAAVAIGQDSAVLVPEGTLTKNMLQMIEAERTGAGSSGYDAFLKSQDEALMRIVVGQPGTSKGVSSGLNSNQATEHAEVKAEIVKADSDLISEAINRTFAVWLTRWNHGSDVAPPTVYRVLDEPEDLDKIADRDVKLKSIGIVRTEDSVADVYGPGYELKEQPDPVEQALKLAQAKAGAVPPVAANNNDPKAAAKARIAAFCAEYGVDDQAPLYVSRKLLNGAELIAWAKAQGFKTTVPVDDLHVTILYSKTPVDWFGMGEPWSGDDQGRIVIRPGGPRAVEQFGHDGETAIVLRFESSDLRWRHDSMVERGASSDCDAYKPHVTFTYDPGEVDLDKVEPFEGELRFGPEIFAPLRDSDPLGVGESALDFTAADEEAIDRLIAKLVEEADPVFEAMASELRTNLQGVSTLEGARVAILSAMERMPVERLARLTALPMLAERAGARIGADSLVDA